MGRPLNKKYFGNRNTGSASTTADNKIGGEGVASVVLNALGSYTTRPTVTFPIPALPTGVTATGTITARAKTATISTSGTIAYAQSEVVSSVGGTTWTVTKEAEQSVTIASTNNGGPGGTARIVLTGAITAVKGANFLTANNISGCGLTVSTNYYILDGGTGTTFTITDSYANAVAGTPMTLGSTGSATNGGVGIGSIYAPVASVTVSLKGSFPATGGALSTSANATTSTTGFGAGLTIAISAYESKEVVITEKGSGYTSAPTGGSLTFTQSVTATSTALTVDSGVVGSATNQENAIIIRANTGNEGANISDIIRQVSGRRYKVISNGTIAICKLVADDTPALCEAYIIATASNGSTYYVTKLTARRARLTYKAGTQIFDDGESAPWSFTSTADGCVIIENA